MSPTVRPLAIEGVYEIVPKRFGDDRGYFSETFNGSALAAHGLRSRFVQDNQSYSAATGTLRGLHYQAPPFAQDKLVRVLRGTVFDVAVDVRPQSPTFGTWLSVTLSAEAGNQILIPQGFAHGFLTLTPDTEVSYKVSRPYSPAHERTIRFDDPDIAIAWPLPAEGFVLSDKDRAGDLLATSGLVAVMEDDPA